MKNVNLVNNFFSKNIDSQVAIFCTYGFNLRFFEQYLMKIDLLSGCNDICIFTDYDTYNNFQEQSYIPKFLNKKYIVIPVSSVGVFHTKLYITASEKKVLLGIGSANLTRDSIASNLEILSFFKISNKNQDNTGLLRNCIDYLNKIIKITGSKQAKEYIEKLEDLCTQIIQEDNTGIKFIHNLKKTISEQITEYIGKESVQKIQVISPFYDNRLEPLKWLNSNWSDSNKEIYIQQEKSTFPKKMFSKIKNKIHILLFKNIKRYLHGKSIIFNLKNKIILYCGSANFTESALLMDAKNGNYEIGLLGEISPDFQKKLIKPNKKQAKKVKSDTDIIIQNQTKHYTHKDDKIINFLVEANREHDEIKIIVNNKITNDQFSPKEILLFDFSKSLFKQKITDKYLIKLNSKMKDKLQDIIGIQIIGNDIKNNILKSNKLWVINLETDQDNKQERKFRKAYKEPFEIPNLLQKILDLEGKTGLIQFLMNYDIPLDLILPPRKISSPGEWLSKGNIEGTLPYHNFRIWLHEEVIDAYKECIERLYNKLEKHYENPQYRKYSNFLLILSALFNFLNSIDNQIFQEFKNKKIVEIDEWSYIRKYYNIIFKYLKISWKLLWKKDGYNDKIKQQIPKEFIEFLQENGYNEQIKHINQLGLENLNNFEQIKNSIKVNASGNIIEPKIFFSHRYLNERFEIKDYFEKIGI